MDDSFEREIYSLQQAYKAGNLGALKDAVWWCEKYHQPLRPWISKALYEVIDALATADKRKLQLWKGWFKKYQQDINDFERFEHVIDAREHGATWIDGVYPIAGITLSGRLEEDGGIKSYTLEKSYKRFTRRIKNNPFRYKLLMTFRKDPAKPPLNKDLQRFIKETIGTGNPKGIKKQ